MKTLVLIALMAAVAVKPSHAGARNFFTPTVGGDRLSFCANTGSPCGKPIADAWCRAIGFEAALTYQRDRAATGQPIIARYADTGGLCSGEDCESFKQIKCWIGKK